MSARFATRFGNERRFADERGSMLPLMICFCLLGITLVALVSGATSLYLERERLFTVADGAALAAAEAFTVDNVTVSGDAGGSGDLKLVLDQAEMTRAATEYLTAALSQRAAQGSSSAAGRGDVTLVRAVSPDGDSAEVTLRSVWRPPITLPLFPTEIPVEVTVTARSVLRGTD